MIAQHDRTVVILGTGGTIAGTAGSATDNVGYSAAQLGVQAPGRRGAAAGRPCASNASRSRSSTARTWTTRLWQRLAQRVAHHLARADVAGVVITHGTDTLEETAYFLHRVLAPAKPVVLTARHAAGDLAAGRRPAEPARCGDRGASCPARAVCSAVLAGRVHAGADVRKVHSYRLDAFDAGDAGPIGVIEEGRAAPLARLAAGAGLGPGGARVRRRRAGRAWRS